VAPALRPRLIAVPPPDPAHDALADAGVVGRPAIAPLGPASPSAQTHRTRRTPRTAPPGSDAERPRLRPLRAGALTGQPRPAVRRPTTDLAPAVRPEPDLDLAQARRFAPDVELLAPAPAAPLAYDPLPVDLEASPEDDQLFDPQALVAARRRRALVGIAATAAVVLAVVLSAVV